MSHSFSLSIFFSFVLCAGMAQVSDDFTDGLLSTEWIGDQEKFIINDDAQLQLSDSDAGEGALFHPYIWSEDQTWTYYTLLDFSPSNSNRLEMILWSDTPDQTSTSGYSIRIGQSGSNDALTLYQLEDGDRDKISAGTAGLVATGPVIIRVNCHYDNGQLSIQADDMGGQCYLDEILESVTAPQVGQEVYFGIYCEYTSTRRDKFYFDDIYVGQKQIDSLPPSVLTLRTTPQLVEVTFTEVVDTSSIKGAQIVLSPEISDADIKLEKGRLLISSNQGLDNTSDYMLEISGVRDLAGNAIDTILFFNVAGLPKVGTLHLNEILFDPSPGGSDFVEIYNSSAGKISIEDLLLENRENGRAELITGLPSIAPESFFVLTEDRSWVMERYPDHDPAQIYEVDLPSFANASGNATISFEGIELDLMNYTEEMHVRFIDDTEDISLERLSLERPADDPSNWSSASVQVGATPGLSNSSTGVPSTQNIFETTVKVFSPDGDGLKEEGLIDYQLDAANYIGSAQVYSDHGYLIRQLWQNINVPLAGTIRWDGRTDDGQIAPQGFYIVRLDFFNEEGDREVQKLTLGLVK